MHEISLARTLLEQARAVADRHGGGVVREVCLQIGPLSGVEPQLLDSAWTQVTADTELAGAHLRILDVPLEAVCRVCGNGFEIVDFDFRCSQCGSGQTEVVRGEGVILQSVTLDEARAGVSG